ncbi:DUF6379 domain-containing protein [Oscillospiraceae bacterium OttesenSCG-928-F05]|nr:DUF6379 domain-containing protein [Oscillospiraceae bacterium OttesenSCG-928-F05]
MNEKYVLCGDTAKNVTANGEITGFSFRVRIPYYRGVALSLIDDICVCIDGEDVPREALRFEVAAGGAFTLDEMLTVTDYRWEYGEKALLTVQKPGGLTPGEHTVTLRICLRISYMPKGLHTQVDEKIVIPA